MMDINETAEQLKKAIVENKLGFERELLNFFQDYVFSPDIKKQAMKLTYKLKRDVTDEEIKNQTFELIDTILSQYSTERRELHITALSQQEKKFNLKYNRQREITFSCSKLKKAYKTGFTLGEIDLTIRKGDITGVVGENGNGKTTFFRMVAGELRHDGGEINYPFLEQSSSTKPDIDWGLVKSKLAYVPQELPPWYGNLRHHLQYEAAIHGIKGKDNILQVEYIVERLGLQDHINKKWKQLSGGFRFRFALAKALVWQPDMMILDEPLANLDPNAQLSILRDIKHLATSVSHPIAVFISSQHIHEVEAIADNLLFLRQGKAVFNDSMQNLGLDRSENTFEIGSALSFQQFTALFPKSMEVLIRHDGLHYIVTTPLTIKQTDILKILINNNIDLRYFRDISYSSKKLFMQAA